jgi:hypothetical protein
MPDGFLHARRERQPGADAGNSPDQGRNNTNRGTVDQHDETDESLGGAKRTQDPKLTQASLRDHDEPGRGDQRDQQEGDRGDPQHSSGDRHVLAGR